MVRTFLRAAALALLGAVVATVGVGAHRAYGYIGVALGLLLVATAGVFARAWGRWLGFAAYAVGWVVLTLIYAQTGPGNSILVAADANGLLWIWGGSIVLVLIALAPRRWLEGRGVEDHGVEGHGVEDGSLEDGSLEATELEGRDVEA